jgi:hypothetical protein
MKTRIQMQKEKKTIGFLFWFFVTVYCTGAREKDRRKYERKERRGVHETPTEKYTGTHGRASIRRKIRATRKERNRGREIIRLPPKNNPQHLSVLSNKTTVVLLFSLYTNTYTNRHIHVMKASNRRKRERLNG